MKSRKRVRVIFDTNVWISYLIGKHLHGIKALIAERKLTIVLTDQLIEEIQLVTTRPKLAKYFPASKVEDLLYFLEAVGEKHKISHTNHLCRDEKDNFLLDLMEASQAQYLVTGDKDLLELNPFRFTEILTPGDFEKIIEI